MRLKRFFSAALSAAFLAGLCACAPNETSESGGPSASGGYAGPHFFIPGIGGLFGNSSSVPEVPPPPEYDREHRLNAEIPGLIDGLEMPVAGATGYTSVELPLWPSIPAEDPEDPGDAENPAPETPPDTSPDGPLAESGPWDGSAGSASDGPVVLDPAHRSEDASSEPPDASEPPEEPDPYEGAVAVWAPGTAFVILGEDGGWWLVTRDGVFGWIEHRYCMINLPDVIPSIIYDDTNSYSSLFVSCGKDIPGITGEALYTAPTYTGNARLGRREFMMPMLYSAARHICAAQHRALEEGNCLAIYQTFRPYDTQRAVVKAMTQLAKDDPEVKAGISTSPWSMAWFINTGISNHQRGYALDVSLVKVYETEAARLGGRPYLRMAEWEYYEMPTAMHELSMAAISTISPGSSQLSETMNEPAIALRGYFTASGLSPLASEWWHFNDNAAMRDSADKPSDGRYFITECLSCLPEEAAGLLDFYMTEYSEEPGPGETEPGTTGTEPGTTGTEPETAGTEPGTAGTEPGTAGTEPGTTGTEPETAGTEPETAGTESKAEGTDLETGTETGAETYTGTDPETE